MKNILVPVDFSKEAENAAHYAAELAKQTGARVTLFYVFHLPVPISEAPYPIDFSRLERENNTLLTGLSKAIERKHHIRPAYISRPGFAVDEIIDITSGTEYDLIVMGNRGTGGTMSHLLGSTSGAVLRRSHIPVLVIPPDAKFRSIVHIVMACDFHEIKNPVLFRAITSLSKRFHSEVALLNVILPGALPERKLAVEGIKLEHYLEGIKHEFYFEENEHVEEGVEHFLHEHPSDLLVLVIHEHSFLDRLFFKLHTKKIMRHVSIPLLALPDSAKKITWSNPQAEHKSA